MASEPAGRPPQLTFLGAAGTVTGSRFLVDAPRARVLVDVGLFQGLKELRQRNREPLPVDPRSVDAVIATHAHVDHIGYLPVLTRDGFTGPVCATRGTVDLAAIVLPDSGHLQEEEAAFANRMGFSKHRPALPLYTEADALASLEQFRATPYDHEWEVAPGVHCTFQPAGHILGSSTVSLRLADAGDLTVLFSGDLGRSRHPLLRPPRPISGADVIVVESTYGDRLHDDAGALERFGDAIRRTVSRGGMVLIPAFAVDRTEVILYHLKQLADAGEIPRVPLYVDSPMALAALRVYRNAIARRDPELARQILDAVDPFDHSRLVEVQDVADSKALASLHFPSIIVSASGMATGGRVVHHLERLLPDPRNTVILAGFQAPGTRGQALADGARELKMLGHYVPVRADIVDVGAFSVHADHDELLHWLGTAPAPPDALYVVHGEPAAAEALRSDVTDRLGWLAVAPRHLERVRLDGRLRRCASTPSPSR